MRESEEFAQLAISPYAPADEKELYEIGAVLRHSFPSQQLMWNDNLFKCTTGTAPGWTLGITECGSVDDFALELSAVFPDIVFMTRTLDSHEVNWNYYLNGQAAYCSITLWEPCGSLEEITGKMRS